MPEQITFLHFIDGPRRAPLEQLVQEFNKGQTHAEVVPLLTTEAVTDSAAENSAQLDSLPEHLRNPHNWPDIGMVYGESVAQLVEADAIVPLDRYFDDDGLDRSDFWPRLLDTVSYKGSIWAMPIEGNPYVLFCNRDLFSAVGLGLPANWEELIAAARACTRDTDGDGKPDLFGYTQCAFQVPLLMWQSGAELVGPEGEILFDSEEAAEAIQFHSHIRQYSPPHVDFERGDVAMKISIVENLWNKRYEHLNFCTIPLAAGKVRANSFGGSNSTLDLVVFRNGAERERAAWEFLKWFASERAAMQWTKITGYLPMRRSILECAAMQELLDKTPNLRAFADELPYCQARACVPHYRQVKWAVNGVVAAARQGWPITVAQVRELLHQAAEKMRDLVPVGA